MSLRVVAKPTERPISLVEVKAQAKVDHTDEDALIQSYVDAAVGAIDGPEGWLGRCLMTQTLELTVDRFPKCQGWIRLPCPPLQLTGSPAAAAVTISYLDDAGNSQTLASTVYHVSGAGGLEPATIVLAANQSWPTTLNQRDAVKITYTAGYGSSATDVPAPIRQALRMLASYWVSQREAALIDPEILEVPFGVKQLLMPFKVHGF